MNFKVSNKRILVLALFLVVVIGVIFLWQNYRLDSNYFDKLKSFFSRVNIFKATIAPELLSPEDLGLDLSEINIENLLLEKEVAFEVDQEEELVKEVQIKEVQEEEDDPEYQAALAEIKKELDRIEKEVEEVRRKVNKLKALTGIQREINRIEKEIEETAKEVDKLTRDLSSP